MCRVQKNSLKVWLLATNLEVKRLTCSSSREPAQKNLNAIVAVGINRPVRLLHKLISQ